MMSSLINIVWISFNCLYIHNTILKYLFIPRWGQLILKTSVISSHNWLFYVRYCHYKIYSVVYRNNTVSICSCGSSGTVRSGKILSLGLFSHHIFNKFKVPTIHILDLKFKIILSFWTISHKISVVEQNYFILLIRTPFL